MERKTDKDYKKDDNQSCRPEQTKEFKPAEYQTHDFYLPTPITGQ